MKLDNNINYIVSGLERSGTSMLMQIIHAGGAPTGFNDSRKADINNPKGYFELEGGKIINKLMEGTFPLNQYKGQFIKITSFGLKYLPIGKYKIIYSERNLEEILDSMEKMADIKDTEREKTRESFIKLNSMIKKFITQRKDIEFLSVNYNDIISDPRNNVKRIYDFINNSELNLENMINIVDEKLYRQRRKNIL